VYSILHCNNSVYFIYFVCLWFNPPLWCLAARSSRYILVINPTRCTTFSNYFWNRTLRVLDSSSAHHQESSTVHTAMVYVIQVMLTACQRDQDGTVPSWSRSQAVSITCTTYTIAVCTVKNSWWWAEEVSETCRVLFQK